MTSAKSGCKECTRDDLHMNRVQGAKFNNIITTLQFGNKYDILGC